MRDGVKLVGEIYFPDGQPTFSSVLYRTPYGRDNSEQTNGYSHIFTSKGFVFLNFDVRGRGDSEGVFIPRFNEGKDGYDMIEWIAKQPWSNGKIGTFGSSYSAEIQWLTALEKPPHLAAMISIVSPSDPFVESPTGVPDPMHLSWRYSVTGRTLKDQDGVDWRLIYNVLPLKDMPKAAGLSLPDWDEACAHQTFDAYWDNISYQQKFNRIDVPVLHISGWYDDEQIGTFINYTGMRNNSASESSRQNQMIVIGPWGHSVNSTRKLGQIDFGPEALIDLSSIETAWFKRWLNEENVQVGKRAKIFLMGKNKWMEFDDWPPKETRSSRLFISSNGSAKGSRGRGDLFWSVGEILDGEDQYFYDPNNPTPYVTQMTAKQIGGPDDFSSVEWRDDVLTYTSSVLEEEVTFLGKVEADIFFKTSVKDTDFMAMLLDVWPNGFAQRLCDGMTRARYRNGMDKQEFLKEGQIYELKINMWNTGHSFKKGHKIRIHICSAAFPKYSRNLNTGLDLATDSNAEIADTKIIHSKTHPSNVSFFLYK